MKKILRTSGGVFDADAIDKKIAETEKLTTAEDFWNDAEKAQKVMNDLKLLKGRVEPWRELLQKIDDIKTLYELGSEGGDESADTYNELAICQMETGDFSGARESLVDALNMDPDNTKIISNLGFLALKQGEEEEARKYFMTVLEIDSKDPVAAAELKKLEQEA